MLFRSVQRFAASQGRDVKITQMPFGSLIAPAGKTPGVGDVEAAWTIAVALLVEVADPLLFVAVTLTDAQRLWPFIALAAGAGATSALGMPSGRALPAMVVPRDVVPAAMTFHSIGFQGSIVAGPAIGGLLFTVDPVVVYATAAALAAVGIAGVLAMSPSILVLDEPSAGLDPAARRRLIGLLRSFDHTRVIATHDLDLVLDVCDRVLVMHGGRIEADGAPAAILRDQTLLERCRLEPPLRWQGV